MYAEFLSAALPVASISNGQRRNVTPGSSVSVADLQVQVGTDPSKTR